MNTKNPNYVSIDVIANKIYKNPLLKDINFEDIIDYTLSIIKLIKVPGVYKEESCYLNIQDHKAVIPKNALNIKTVDYCYSGKLIPMVESTFSLSNQLNKIDLRYPDNNYRKHSYSINNQIITTSCSSGKIFITFDTIKVDEDDIPMIPDSEALLKAIEAHIKVQVYTVLADLQKVSERTLNRAEQEYAWYIGKAQTEFQGFTNEDSMESFLNGWKRTFISDNQHRTRYSDESDKEYLKRL